MDDGTSGEVLLGLAEDFAGDRRGLTLAEQDEPHQVGERVTFGPLEVQVWAIPVSSRILSMIAARALGTAGLRVRSTR